MASSHHGSCPTGCIHSEQYLACSIPVHVPSIPEQPRRRKRFFAPECGFSSARHRTPVKELEGTVSLYCGTHLHASEAQATLNFKTANGFQVRFFPSPKVCQSSTVGFQYTFRAALERYEGVKLVSTLPLPVAKPRPESFAL
eukprot:symbB.v1.2.000550.t1/scaffold19.1/size443072/14